MVNLSKIQFVLILLITSFFSLNVSARQQDYPFKLMMRADSGVQKILARNAGPAPVWATISLTVPENTIIDRPSPFALLVPPGETVTLATVKSAVQGKQIRIATHYKFAIGTPDVMQNPNTVYLLPFKDGQAVIVGQVLGGKISTHNNPASKYAIDFMVPIGTPIVAARKGRVVDVDQNYSEGGMDPMLKANHVLILHEDGTLGLYSHLSQNRISVSFGQQVEAGELIGYSGNTGYSSGPHLHFVVLSNTRTEDGSAQYLAQPVAFINDVPQHILLLHQYDKVVTRHSDVLPRVSINSP